MRTANDCGYIYEARMTQVIYKEIVESMAGCYEVTKRGYQKQVWKLAFLKYEGTCESMGKQYTVYTLFTTIYFSTIHERLFASVQSFQVFLKANGAH